MYELCLRSTLLWLLRGGKKEIYFSAPQPMGFLGHRAVELTPRIRFMESPLVYAVGQTNEVSHTTWAWP